MRFVLALVTIGALNLLLGSSPVLALDPSLEVSQYAHTAWTIREGFFKGNIYSIAQGQDGYLWLGTEFGLLRFDGNRSILWQPPSGQTLPGNGITSLLAASDGTLWIGTYAGLVSWNGSRLTRYPELDNQLVASLLQDHEGTVWAGSLGYPFGRLCAIRNGSVQCYGQDGTLGRTVLSLFEDSTGNLWAGTQLGLWRWRPDPPTHHAVPGTELNDLNVGDQGQLFIAMPGGMRQLVHGKAELYPTPSAKPINANRLLRDHDGGLWIGTLDRGLIHVYHGKTDVFSKSDGLSGDLIFSLFEDREGNVWVSTNGGLDRFRDLTISTVSLKQGLSSDFAWSVLAARDGSVWVGTGDGLNKWSNGQISTIRNASGRLDDAPQSLFQDDRGRIWGFTGHGLAHIGKGGFVPVSGVHGTKVHSIAGDRAGNLWLSETSNLLHIRDGRLVEQIPWSRLGRSESASVLISDHEHGGLWLGFWRGGGVLYFKDGQVRASYTSANGLSSGAVTDLRLDGDGALWVSTQSVLDRVKDGHITTLTNQNGLPCDIVLWTMEDDDHSLWLYTACGLVRIARTELDAWIADPKRTIGMNVLDSADGVRLRSTASSAYGPRVAKSTDGRLWFVTGEGVQIINPHHLFFNKLPPPVHIEQVTADHKIRWQNLSSEPSSDLRLPRLTRDLEIDYAAVSLVAPEKTRFKYKLEGYNGDWQDAGNRRQAFYTNLSPAHYRFDVIACNNSGVWNETGASLEFSIAPAYYQTNWFRALCAVFLLALVWAGYQWRLRQVHHQFALTLEARVGERTRIARDLHDTLLASFYGLLFLIQAARNMLPQRPEEAIGALDGVITRAEQAITEGRDAIQNLRAVPVAEDDLEHLLTATGQELACSQEVGHGSPTFRVTVEGPRQTLSPVLQDEIYRIAREVLRNAFQHANACQIEAEIRYDAHLFRLRIRDDGKGIDQNVLSEGRRAGHWGLPGIRERAKQIGARLDFWSQAGAGTEVELVVPASIAYERSHDGQGFWLFHRARNHEHRS